MSHTTTTLPQSTTTTVTTTTDNLGVTLFGDVDCNGSRDVGDAVLLARFLAEDQDAVVTDQGRKNADCNKNGGADTFDVQLILKAIALIITLE